MQATHDVWRHILKFLSNNHIYQSTLTLNHELFELSFDSLNKTNSHFQWVCSQGHSDTVKRFLKYSSIDPTFDDNKCLQWACLRGRAQVVQVLLQDGRIDPALNDNHALKWSAFFGHLSIVELLLQDQRVDPCAENHFAIREAYQNGYLDVAQRIAQDYRVVDLQAAYTKSDDEELTTVHKKQHVHKHTDQCLNHEPRSVVIQEPVSIEEENRRRKHMRRKIKRIRSIILYLCVPILVTLTMILRYEMGYYTSS